MKQARWNGVVIAESDDIVMVEGNAYFPESALKKEYFQATETLTTCAWKGTANYLSVVVNGQINLDAAWSYARPSDAAKQIAGRVAFWKGVTVSDS